MIAWTHAESGVPMNILERAKLENLFELLQSRGYEVVGPALRDQAIVFDTISRAAELPEGWTDTHGKGSYRLERTGNKALFQYAAGARSPKHFLIPPRRLLYRAHGSASDFNTELPQEPVPRFAFLGVRACDLAAIERQDDIFMRGRFVDPVYKARREQALIIALNCAAPAHNCFCSSMGVGPEVTSTADMVMTEVVQAKRHYFTLFPLSATGAELIEALNLPAATKKEAQEAQEVVGRAADQMDEKRVELEGLREVLAESMEDDHWEEVAERCLACANCTMACPTCFCATVEDTTSLAGDSAERWRVWDSCFTSEFSYIHGGSVRKSIASRYRQWLTHKFSTWQDQFGALGCVGCGRCITWCPAQIDVTEELAALQAKRRPQTETRGKRQPQNV